MNEFYDSCQGESHIESNKVCQDASYSEVNERMSIAIVCDGHGGVRYFRSDIGAQKAIEATKQCVSSFVDNIDIKAFAGKPFTQKLAITSEAKAGQPTKDTITDKAFRQLFSSIIYNWREAIGKHAAETPLSEKEKSDIEEKYINDFINGIGLEKTYGCTLMCYVKTDTYWFAFHIGDGKCIAFDNEGKWSEPIPWDEQCFLNKTTSLCDSSALDEFRYCYCGDGTSPMAVFLGSDGIDDSFGETENMINFYVQILKLLANEEEDKTNAIIKETLPELSKIGSKDDMSIACVYDNERLKTGVKSLITWQKKNVEDQIFKTNERILKLRDEIKSIEAAGLNTQKVMIEFQYAQKDLSKAFERKRLLVTKWNKVAKELNPVNFSSYKDEIGLSENDSDEEANEVDSIDEETMQSENVTQKKNETT